MIPLDDLIGCFSFVRENSIKSFVLLNFGGKLQHMNVLLEQQTYYKTENEQQPQIGSSHKII